LCLQASNFSVDIFDTLKGHLAASNLLRSYQVLKLAVFILNFVKDFVPTGFACTLLLPDLLDFGKKFGSSLACRRVFRTWLCKVYLGLDSIL
jgi:hypothetical protein